MNGETPLAPLELSEAEKRAVEILRSQQLKWQRYKWLGLFVGVTTALAACLVLLKIAGRAADMNQTNWEDWWVCPLFWGLFAVGIIVSVTILIKWRGDPKVTLLLRLVDNSRRV
jgi:hypothetical protein